MVDPVGQHFVPQPVHLLADVPLNVIGIGYASQTGTGIKSMTPCFPPSVCFPIVPEFQKINVEYQKKLQTGVAICKSKHYMNIMRSIRQHKFLKMVRESALAIRRPATVVTTNQPGAGIAATTVENATGGLEA